jgi:hypothetical protein
MKGERKMIKLLHITRPEEAWEILDESAGLFGDNGGQPDGNAFLRPIDDFEPEEVEKVVSTGVAEVVEGEEDDYPRCYHHQKPNGAVLWCGYQTDRDVYYIK